MPAVVSQSLRGFALDLTDPSIEQVDFGEIADTLSKINHFNGATTAPLSAAQRTLIEYEATPLVSRPWALLRRCHEARIGAIADETIALLAVLAGETHGVEAQGTIPAAIREARMRHDLVIHSAAGWQMPDPVTRLHLERAEAIANRTIIRDFFGDVVARGVWPRNVREAPPLRKAFSHRPAAAVAIELHTLFRTVLNLPTNRAGRAGHA